MKKLTTNEIIPENKTGKPIDIIKTITEKATEQAITSYKRIYERLLQPGAWEKLQNITAAAAFKIHNPEKMKKATMLEESDYIKIDIPGPGLYSGNGFDWVKTENVLKDFDPAANESFTFTLRPSANPDNDQSVPAHFFTDAATSTFILKRTGKIITLSYHGRNESPNNNDTNMLDTLRNSLVAVGAIVGISKIHWENLLEGLIKE